jgi:hypothetical protein
MAGDCTINGLADCGMVSLYMPRSVVVAFLMATLLGQLAAETRWAGGGALSPRVGIFLDFDLTPSQSALETMQREVGAVLSETGAQFSWLMLKTDSARQTFDALAVLRFRGSCRAGALKPVEISRARLTLGSSDVSAKRVTAYSNVECGEIQNCLAGLLATFCPRDRDEAFGRAMGRVVAHELCHILGDTTEHARSGINSAVQTPFDLIRRDFKLDGQILLRLRQRLQPKKEWSEPPSAATRPTTITLAERF